MLQDMYQSRSPLYDDQGMLASRMEAVNVLGSLLQKAAALPLSAAEADQKQLYRQVGLLVLASHGQNLLKSCDPVM